MSADRRHSRVLAMQALCQWDVQGDESSPALEEFLARAMDAALGCEPAEQPHEPQRDRLVLARDLINGFWRQKERIDARLAAASPKWDLERMSVVERNVLRVAVVEMLSGQTPPRVVLDEAIEIAREYGGADSPRFVNGVLDQVFRRIQSESGKAD